MSEHVEMPDRPAIPVPLYALVAVIAAERAILRGARPWLEGVPCRIVFALVAIGVVCALVGRMLGRPAPRWLVVVCAGLVCSVVLASLTLDRGELLSASLASRSVSTCRFEMLSDPRESSSGYRARARAVCEDGGAGDVWITLPQAVSRPEIIGGSYKKCSYKQTRKGDIVTLSPTSAVIFKF